MTSLFQYLQDSLHVTPVDGDKLEVTVTLPSDHFLHFLRILESLTGFVKIVQKHERLQRIKSAETLELQKQEAERQLAKRNAAIKQICTDLRAKKHPWSSPDLIRPSLVKAGRGGRPRCHSKLKLPAVLI